mmetsp:Transcript_11717/g.49329  ORF Transcript_11717/g.49329 Transcript_11717/m.49329 type:complete len:229 (+) Transcript_11717:468-1154(+)
MRPMVPSPVSPSRSTSARISSASSREFELASKSWKAFSVVETPISSTILASIMAKTARRQSAVSDSRADDGLSRKTLSQPTSSPWWFLWLMYLSSSHACSSTHATKPCERRKRDTRPRSDPFQSPHATTGSASAPSTASRYACSASSSLKVSRSLMSVELGLCGKSRWQLMSKNWPPAAVCTRSSCATRSPQSLKSTLLESTTSARPRRTAHSRPSSRPPVRGVSTHA